MLRLDANPHNKQVTLQIEELTDRTRRGIRQFWFALGKSLLKSFNRAVLKKPRSGRVYKIRRRRHVASKQGESPANITGKYRKSAGYQIQGSSNMVFGIGVEYAGYLENGTKRMRARPGLGNAIKDTEGQSLNDAGNLLENEITKS